MNQVSKLTIFTLLLISMTTMMSNVAIVTALPHLKEEFSNIQNIEFYSRLMLTLPSLAIAILAPILGHIVFKFGKKKKCYYCTIFLYYYWKFWSVFRIYRITSCIKSSIWFMYCYTYDSLYIFSR